MGIALVIHLNAFTGQLQGGYLMTRTDKRRLGANMNPSAVLAYMAAHPGARIDALKV